MQTTPPQKGPSFTEDAECVELNEKSYFRFLVFELLVARGNHSATKKKI